MKKIETFLIITFLILTASCGSNQNKSEKIDQEIQSEKSENNLLISNEKTDEDFYKIGEKLMEEESFGKIKIGMSFDNILSLLSQPDVISHPVFSEVDGENYQTIEYKNQGIFLGLKINADSTKIISWIEIKEPCELKTSQKIGIGSNLDEINIAYKNEIDPKYSDSEEITIGSIYYGMFIRLKNNKVTKIYLGPGAD